MAMNDELVMPQSVAMHSFVQVPIIFSCSESAGKTAIDKCVALSDKILSHAEVVMADDDSKERIRPSY